MSGRPTFACEKTSRWERGECFQTSPSVEEGRKGVKEEGKVLLRMTSQGVGGTCRAGGDNQERNSNEEKDDAIIGESEKNEKNTYKKAAINQAFNGREEADKRIASS